MAELIDRYGRLLKYVRISVTDRCNFRCTYCMPEDGVECISHKSIMRYEEIDFLCDVLWDLGVRKFRFTGGEPFVRRDFVPFLKDLRERYSSMKIALTTNASMLAPYAAPLSEIGIHSLNISLDTLDPIKFKKITRIGNFDDVMKGIKAAKDSGIGSIKLNVVLIRGFNDGEISSLLEFASNNGLLLRLIEFMPIENEIWDEESFISGDEILSNLPGGGVWERMPSNGMDEGPAAYYKNSRSGHKIGIITAVSDHFCNKCNRLRISASGQLRLCLFSPEEIPLRELILKRDTEGLKRLILESIENKPRGWEKAGNGELHMSGIGG
jgi:cyclic pyranopterin phosphate synthase